ncbi:MAG: hypothetical protein AAF492_05635, partial [Verrucomicrobiota bacterium]
GPRLNPDLHQKVCKAMIAWIARQTVRLPENEQPSDEEQADVVRAESVLTDGYIPSAPSLIVAEMARNPADIYVFKLVDLLSKMKNQVALLPVKDQTSMVNSIMGMVNHWAKPDAKEDAKKAIDTAGKILLAQRFPEVPVLLAGRLNAVGQGPLADWLVEMLKSMSAQFDPPAMKVLAAHTRSHAAHHSHTAGLLMDGLEKLAARPGTTPGSGSKRVAALQTLSVRLEPGLRIEVVEALTQHVYKQSEPRTPPLTDTEKHESNRAESFLVDSRLPEATGYLVDRLLGAPNGPVSERMESILIKMKDRLDDEDYKKLFTHLAQNGANRISAALVVTYALEDLSCEYVPHRGPTYRGAPDLKNLPARLDGKLQADLINGLVAFLKKQFEARKKDSPALEGKEKEAIERVERTLVQSDPANVAKKLVTELIQNPPVQVAEEWAGLLKQIPRRIDEKDFAALHKFAATDGHNKAIATDLVLSILNTR